MNQLQLPQPTGWRWPHILGPLPLYATVTTSASSFPFLAPQAASGLFSQWMALTSLQACSMIITPTLEACQADQWTYPLSVAQSLFFGPSAEPGTLADT